MSSVGFMTKLTGRERETKEKGIIFFVSSRVRIESSVRSKSIFLSFLSLPSPFPTPLVSPQSSG